MIKYIAKITQNGANDPSVVELENLAPITVTWTYGANVGELVGTASSPCFNNDMPPRWYIAESQGGRYSVSQDSQVLVHIQAFDAAGQPSDTVMSGALVEIINTGGLPQ